MVEKAESAPVVVVLCGPTAVGKGTVLHTMLTRDPSTWLSVSATTRAPRPGEIDGKDYYFVTPDEFDELIERGDMLEWATVHGTHRYGTPRGPVEQAQSEGRTVILEVDLSGARQVRKSMPQALQIFLAPPSFDTLAERLAARGTEGPAERARRLETARVEMDAQGEFDVVVINDDVSRATDEILGIISAAR